MSWFSDLFDEEEKDPKIIKTSTLNPEQEGISKALAQWLEPLVGQGVPGYTGDVVAGLSDYETQAFGNIADLVSGASTPLSSDVQGALTRLLSGEPSYDLSDEYKENYYKTNILQPLTEVYQESLPFALENVRGMLRGTPATSLGNVAQKSQEEFMDTLGREKAAFDWKVEEARMKENAAAFDRALQASPIAQMVGQYERERPFAEQQLLAEAGSVSRALEQAQLDWDYQEFLRTQPESAPYLQLALSYLGIPTLATGTTQGQKGTDATSAFTTGLLLSMMLL